MKYYTANVEVVSVHCDQCKKYLYSGLEDECTDQPSFCSESCANKYIKAQEEADLWEYHATVDEGNIH